MQILKQIFDKKSPVFIITITVFIVSTIARSEPLLQTCGLSPEIKVFEILLIVTTAIQIVFKTVVIEIFNKFCTSSISAIHNFIVVTFILVNLSMYAWSVHLYLSLPKYPNCVDSEPHPFFITVYFCLYTLINVVVAATIICLRLENKTMTVFDREPSFQLEHQ